MLEVANFAVAVTNMVASVYLAFLAVRFTAKPRINITLAGEKDTHRLEFSPGETVDLLFVLTNIGYWYAHPTALDNTCYLNFDPRFELIEAKYGSILENSETNVRRGKNNCQYLKVSGIQLSYGEPGELILVTVKMPDSSSTYPIWISSRTSNGGHGVHRFSVAVKTDAQPIIPPDAAR